MAHDVVRLDGGLFVMGSDAHYPEEAPTHRVWVSAFAIDRFEVATRQFAAFVEATGGAAFTWGDEARPDRRIMANTWDGLEFPWRSTGESGWLRTAPVGCFPPNGFGLRDMAGNVWEWTDDWWTGHHPADAEHPCCVPEDPRGGTLDASLDPAQPQFRVPRKVVKGGSHLCADTYCLRYRPAARRPQMVDTGMSHMGFRCAWDLPISLEETTR